MSEREITPACDTDKPASSINWSIENAPVDMSSWSNAAALLAERVWIELVNVSIDIEEWLCLP